MFHGITNHCHADKPSSTFTTINFAERTKQRARRRGAIQAPSSSHPRNSEGERCMRGGWWIIIGVFLSFKVCHSGNYIFLGFVSFFSLVHNSVMPVNCQLPRIGGGLCACAQFEKFHTHRCWSSSITKSNDSCLSSFKF